MNDDIGGKLRMELRKLLASSNFQKLKDVDQMTEILMDKLGQIADKGSNHGSGSDTDTP